MIIKPIKIIGPVSYVFFNLNIKINEKKLKIKILKLSINTSILNDNKLPIKKTESIDNNKMLLFWL